MKGEIIVSNRKRADLFVELQTKRFHSFPKKTKAVEPEVAGATDDTEETEVKSPADSSSNGVQISDYEIFCIIGHFCSSYGFNAFLYILLTQLKATQLNILCILGSYL